MCTEFFRAASESRRFGDCVPTDLGTLAGTGEGGGLAEFVGDSLRDDVADLVRRGGWGKPPASRGREAACLAVSKIV